MAEGNGSVSGAITTENEGGRKAAQLEIGFQPLERLPWVTQARTVQYCTVLYSTVQYCIRYNNWKHEKFTLSLKSFKNRVWFKSRIPPPGRIKVVSCGSWASSSSIRSSSFFTSFLRAYSLILLHWMFSIKSDWAVPDSSKLTRLSFISEAKKRVQLDLDSITQKLNKGQV